MSAVSPNPHNVGKANLLDILIIGYAYDIGPGMIAELTGYSQRMIRRYANTLGISFGHGRHSKMPDPVPPELIIALMQAGVGMSYSFKRRNAA